MNTQLRFGTAVAAGLAVAAAGLLGARPAARAAMQGTREPVIVELFTSEGCSSCPPADSLALRLEKSQPVPGAQIIVLGQHVDYWNSARWADRFSSATYSRRQEEYARQFHLDSVYTPEMVVDGRAEFVGSDGDRAGREIAEAARSAKADVHVTIAPSPRTGVLAKVHIDHFPAGGTGEAATVFLAVAEDGLHSHVAGGENAGRSLAHCTVVRRMGTIGTVNASPTASFDATVPVKLNPGWQPDKTEMVVFVQAHSSGRILGAGVSAL